MKNKNPNPRLRQAYGRQAKSSAFGHSRRPTADKQNPKPKTQIPNPCLACLVGRQAGRRAKSQIPKVTVVIPTYNEAENIELLVRKIFSLKIPNLSIIIVDDNSPDGTGVIVERLKSKIKNKKSKINLDVIHRKKKLGLGSAYLAGFEKALEDGADYIISMDADFSHNPTDILRLLEKAKDYDLVIGSRYVQGGKFQVQYLNRKVLSWLANILTRLLLHLSIKDCTAGFKCYSRRFIQSLDFGKIDSPGYAFQVEMVYNVKQNGFSFVEIPIIFVDRNNGKSKVDLREILTSARSIFKLTKKNIIRTLFW